MITVIVAVVNQCIRSNQINRTFSVESVLIQCIISITCDHAHKMAIRTDLTFNVSSNKHVT